MTFIWMDKSEKEMGQKMMRIRSVSKLPEKQGKKKDSMMIAQVEKN